jgi:HSP20 family protein
MLKTIVNATPITEFRSFDDMFERLMGIPHRTGAGQPGNSLLPLDVVERDGSLVIKAAVPGLEPEQVDIQIENNVLTIQGELKSDYEDSKAKVYHREYSYGKFSRSVRLPEEFDIEKVKATFKNGFVTVTLPRLEQPTAKSRRIPVEHIES